jgi:hypothetical protein
VRSSTDGECMVVRSGTDESCEVVRSGADGRCAVARSGTDGRHAVARSGTDGGCVAARSTADSCRMPEVHQGGCRLVSLVLWYPSSTWVHPQALKSLSASHAFDRFLDGSHMLSSGL